MIRSLGTSADRNVLVPVHAFELDQVGPLIEWSLIVDLLLISSIPGLAQSDSNDFTTCIRRVP